jgi:hypothetical protein
VLSTSCCPRPVFIGVAFSVLAIPLSLNRASATAGASGAAWHPVAGRESYHDLNESKHNPTIALHGYIRASEPRWGRSGVTAPLSLQFTFGSGLEPRYFVRNPPAGHPAHPQADASKAQTSRSEAHLGLQGGRATVARASKATGPTRAGACTTASCPRATRTATTRATCTLSAVGPPKRRSNKRKRCGSSCGPWYRAQRLRATCISRGAHLR